MLGMRGIGRAVLAVLLRSEVVVGMSLDSFVDTTFYLV